MISRSNKETEKIAKEFLVGLEPQENKATLVGLYGELGTGKTTFTQLIAKELNIKKKVTSPTFVIMKKYKIHPYPTSSLLRGRKGEGLKKFGYLFHIDAYRLKNEKELLHLGWDEIIGNKEHLIFIEWPERVIKSLPKKHHEIHISHLPRRSDAKVGTQEGHRKFEIKNI
jgi:tRNA threonylcarbamoyladenosine biosynthesis protein TsaE